MSKVTAIRQRAPTAIMKRIDDARDLIFQAQSITAVAAAAAVSSMPANAHSMENTLWAIVKMLDKVAAIIDPGYFIDLKTDADGQGE